MRKHGFLFAVTAALAVMMCGCGNANSVDSPANPGESKEQTSSDASFLTVVPNSNSSGIFSDESKAITKAEVEQIVACFKEWSYLDFGLHPDINSDYFPECLDESQFITEEITRKGSVMTYTENFFKVVSGDYATEDGFNKTLGKMFTEKFKERYMGSSSGAMFRFKDGETYVAGYGYSANPEWVFELDMNIKYLDDNSVEVTLVHDTDDGEDRCSAVLVKAEDGNYRIDDSDLFDIPNLFHCKSANITVYQNDNVLFTL